MQRFRIYYLLLFQINHVPGIGYIANKKVLCTMNGGSKYIPKTFRVPAEKEMFLNYVSIVFQLIDYGQTNGTLCNCFKSKIAAAKKQCFFAFSVLN